MPTCIAPIPWMNIEHNQRTVPVPELKRPKPETTSWFAIQFRSLFLVIYPNLAVVHPDSTPETGGAMEDHHHVLHVDTAPSGLNNSHPQNSP